MLLLLASCGEPDLGPSVLDEPAASPAVRPSSRTSAAVPLNRLPGTFVLPPSSRPEGAPAPAFFPVHPFVFHEARAKANVYKTPLPIRHDLLPIATDGTHQFGSIAPPGLVVTSPTGDLPFAKMARTPNSFGFDREWLFVAVPSGTPQPEPAGTVVVFPKATATENAMNLATSGLSPEDFVRRSLTVRGASHTGLFLPPPAEATFSLTVPERGRLSFDAQILVPAIASEAASDGAAVEVAVRVAGVETAVGTLAVPPGKLVPGRFDLAAWSGQAVELILRTAPSAHPTFDYLLLEGPVVYAPKDDPERILLVFIDTLRPDHLGYMGYERDTSPVLDRLATHAAVFTEARTVAPWTLPSTRALLTGREPEHWYGAPTLQQTLSDAGWRTDAIVTNAFLSQPFDLQVGWDRYVYEHLLPAADVVDRGRKVIRENPDRDLLLMVHFMGPHIPYDEPNAFRTLWAGDQPKSLKGLTKYDLGRVRTAQSDFAEVRDWVVARYDQNVRATDDAVRPLLEEAGRRATVVVFSDHGEELWEHEGFEHGHSFYDEVLRVVLAIRSPYLPAGRFDAPVSLLDVAPTVWEIAGSPVPADIPGRSLVGLAHGDPAEGPAFDARSLPFGRPLYGSDGWGVIAPDGESRIKWWDRGGVQSLFELDRDPAERIDKARGAKKIDRWPAALGEALDRPVRQVWRLELRRPEEWLSDATLTVSHPSGLERVWTGYDPRGRAVITPELTDGRVSMQVDHDKTAPKTLYIVPKGHPSHPKGLVVTLVGHGVQLAGVSELPPVDVSHDPPSLLILGDGRFKVTVELAWVPEPSGTEVSGYHPEMEDQLRELGYLDAPPEER